MDFSSEQAEKVAQVMSGLSTAVRVRILAHLLDSPATVTELTQDLGLSQAAVSNHLRILRHLNLAKGTREGKNVVYSLPDNHVHTMISEIFEHIQHEDDDFQ